MTAAITCEGVSKRFRIPLDRPSTLKYRVTHWRSSAKFRDFFALDDISFEVPEGQFLGIIGHNGCGKSTLLKILARIYKEDAGRVAINGAVSPFLELGVGFNPELTARENVFLNGAVLGLTHRDMEQRVDEIIAFAEVTDYASQKLKNFSSGMQVRLAFSVAIQAEAQILLMDEVLAVGDASFQEKCFEIFANYKREGRTIVLVTHDLSAIDLYCDRALLLDHGRLIADGPPSEVTALYRRQVGAHSDHSGDEPVADAAPTEFDRWGSREISVGAVRMLDGAGRPRTTFTADQPLTVEVDYEVHDDSVGAFICGLAVQRQDGVALAGPNTANQGRVLACPPNGSRGTIRYEIDKLSLLGAGYFLSVALYDRHAGHAFDHLEKVKKFRVVDEKGRHGMVELGGRWSDELLVDGSVIAGDAPETAGTRRTA